MFPDNDIAKKMTIEADNLYVLNHEILPYFYKILQHEVSFCGYFVVAFDEILNVSQLSQMGTLVRFWDSARNTVNVGFKNLHFLVMQDTLTF